MRSVEQPITHVPETRVFDVAKRTFFNISRAWGVNDTDARVLLGQPSRATYYNWKKGQGGKLPHDTLERISYIIGIYKALQILFPSPAQADAWVSKPNRHFNDRSALQRMLSGNVADLHAVRSYLDYVRGGLA
ncbi:MAG: DUF2384 domain-containing protein [Proteobacteria bacterium]|nr:DUF2384 domain-containing protein [Pseudomonadota bacterium]